MAKVIQNINGQKLIGDVQTDDVEDAAITNAKIATVDGSKVVDASIEVGKLSANLLKYLLGVGRVDYGHVDYCKVG